MTDDADKPSIRAITSVARTPSERLLADLLRASMEDPDGGLSDVIVIWTDQDGRQHMRSARNGD